MQPSRRTVLVAGALGLTAALTAACRHEPTRTPVDPDAGLRAAALEREQRLLAAYQAVLARRPSARLQQLAADKADHVAALGAPGTVPSTITTVAQLRVLERAAAAAHGQAALIASRAFAPQLASLSAASACAVAVL